jgi:aminoglycoside phosphotransferase (APT) family kinase protein
VEALHGGVSSRMAAFYVNGPDGGHAFVLRLYGDEAIQRDPSVAAREFAVLGALQSSTVPVPGPVWVDVEGRTFERPAIVTTLLPGGVLGKRRRADVWVDQLAGALVAIHQHTLTPSQAGEIGSSESLLPEPASQPAERKLEHADGSKIWRILRERQPASARSEAVLLHGDFWFGNTLWTADRLSGVVDWEMPAIGPRGYDVGYCHLDLSLSFGQAVADRFVRSYERGAGQSASDLEWWDLMASWRALPSPDSWLPAWQACGLPTLTGSLVQKRLDALIRNALAQIGTD